MALITLVDLLEVCWIHFVVYQRASAAGGREREKEAVEVEYNRELESADPLQRLFPIFRIT